MVHIINYYTETIKVFTLDQLNNRKQYFNYGPSEIGNISGIIKPNHVTNRCLKMSAREMMTFLHLFPIIIGDLVPESDPVWAFFPVFFEFSRYTYVQTI